MLGGVLLGLVAVAVLVMIAVQVWTRAMRFYGRSHRLEQETRAEFVKISAPTVSPVEPRREFYEIRPRERPFADELYPRPAEPVDTEGSSRVCATCQGTVLVGATLCRHCGATLHAENWRAGSA